MQTESSRVRPTKGSLRLKPARSIARVVFVGVAAIYALALTLYLILRLAFGDDVWWLALLNNFAPFYFLPLIGLLALAVLFRIRMMAFVLPFALIGVIWFGPYYLPKNNALSGGATLRVLTFNVWGDNRHLPEVEVWLRDMNADIVLLQEVPPSYGAEGLVSLLDLYPYQFKQPPELRLWGNVVLSRYPVLEQEYFNTEGDGAPNQQRVTLALEEQTVAVYNVHFLMPVGETPNLSLPVSNPFVNLAVKYDHTARNAQIRRLLDILREESLPYIVIGDFNMSDQTAIYGELAGVMGDSFHEAGWGLGGSWPVSAMEEFTSLPDFIPALFRIDYIWHSRHFRALQAEQGPELGSDHLPLLATLELLPDA